MGKQEQKPEVVRSEVTQQQELEIVRRPLSDDFIKKLQDNIKTLEAKVQTKGQ